MSKLNDGFKTLISFALVASVKLYEKEVTPPGIQAGGEVDTTTMRNNIWRTRNPKQLKTLSNCSFSAAYDTAFFVQANDMIGVNQLITIEFADGSKLLFWGWLDEFTPGPNSEGEMPSADCVIIPSNQNDSGVEVDPVYIDAAGETDDTNND